MVKTVTGHNGNKPKQRHTDSGRAKTTTGPKKRKRQMFCKSRCVLFTCFYICLIVSHIRRLRQLRSVSCECQAVCTTRMWMLLSFHEDGK